MSPGVKVKVILDPKVAEPKKRCVTVLLKSSVVVLEIGLGLRPLFEGLGLVSESNTF